MASNGHTRKKRESQLLLVVKLVSVPTISLEVNNMKQLLIGICLVGAGFALRSIFVSKSTWVLTDQHYSVLRIFTDEYGCLASLQSLPAGYVCDKVK